MLRFAYTLAFAVIVSSPALGQPPAAVPVPPRTAAPLHPQVSYGSHIPIFKSGGQILGRDGIYPYDSGEYLLSGTDGLARYRGGFTMELPSTEGSVLVTGKHRFHSRSGLFRR